MNKEEVVKFMEGLDNLNIFLSEKQYRQFHQFFDLLREWNEVMNLTAITDGIEVVQKHFIDSLTENFRKLRLSGFLPEISILCLSISLGLSGELLKLAVQRVYLLT